MSSDVVVGTVSAVCFGAALVALNAHDQAQDPATDLADVVATLGAVVALATMFTMRWIGLGRRSFAIVRSVAVGVAASAVLVGLVSVVYDPFVN